MEIKFTAIMSGGAMGVIASGGGGGMCAAPEWRLDGWTRSPMCCIGNYLGRRLICICRETRGGFMCKQPGGWQSSG